MSNLSVFNFNSNQVRVVDIDGEPWFVARDVLNAIGSTTKLSDLKTLVVEGLGDEFVTNLPLETDGGQQNLTILSESAITFYVSKSRTELGKKMNRWIHVEVLPSIRKTGTYTIDNKLTETLNTLLKQQQEQQQSLNKLLNDKTENELIGSVVKEEFSGLASLIANTIGEFEVHHLEAIDLYMKGHTYLKLEDVFNSFFPSLRNHYSVLTKARYAIGKCYEELTNRKLPVEKGNFMFNRETVAFALWRITNVAQKEGLLKESPNAIRQQLEELYNF